MGGIAIVAANNINMRPDLPMMHFSTMIVTSSEEISPTHLEGDAAHSSYDSHSELEDTFPASEAIEALTIVLTLISLTILFEKFKHAMEHSAGRVLRPIVDALFGELTVLGFLSIITVSYLI